MSQTIDHSKQMVYWVGRIGDLPTLPAVVYKTIQVVDDPNSSIRQIADVLSQDQSLSTRVLRMANSSYYAIPGGVKTIDRAVTSMGLDAVSQLVFTTAVFSQFDLISSSPFNVREYWKHSLGVAVAAETIAKEIGSKDRSMIFLGGLVHDIGKLAYFQLARDRWTELCEKAKRENMTSLEVERVTGDVPHDDLGYELVKHWRLPAMIQEIVRSHHDATLLSSQAQVGLYSRNVGIVYLANLLVHSFKFGESGHSAVRNPSKEVVKRVLGSEEALLPMAKHVRDALERVEPLVKDVLGNVSSAVSA